MVVNNQPRRAVLHQSVFDPLSDGGRYSYGLVQPLRSTQTSWACTNDKNINRTVEEQLVSIDIFATCTRQLSTLSRVVAGARKEGGWQHIHVGVGHPALKDILKAGNAIQSLASDTQHRKCKLQEAAGI